jgi:peptide deformylase
MAVRKIVTLGHESLARKAAPIEKIDVTPGIGLSAPQVDVGVRLIVVDLSIGEDPNELVVLVNPEIISREGECIREEGCLSVPEVFEKVSRPQKITVRGLDLEGREKVLAAEDLKARAFCHEVDHLDGKLFIDCLSPLKRGLIRKKFKKAAKA